MNIQPITRILDTISDEPTNYRTSPEIFLQDNIRTNIDIGLSILHINIRGVKSNLDKFLVFLQTYNLTSCKIIILTECHKIENKNQFNIPGYNLYYNEAKFNNYDGILVYTKNLEINFKSSLLKNSNVTVTKIIFKINSINFRVFTIYRSPSSKSNIFINEFNAYLFNEAEKIDIDLIIGDINLNILDENHPEINLYQSLLLSHGFIGLIKEVTRPKSNTCLDHLFLKKNISNNQLDFNTFLIDHDLTDHLPILLNITFTNNKIQNNVKPSFIDYERIDFEKLDEYAKKINWDNILQERNPEKAIEILISCINEITDKSKFKFKIKSSNKLKPWITNGIIISIKKRDKMKKHLKNNSNIKKVDEYKNYRNNLNKLITKTKNDYYKQKINENIQDVGKIYKIVSDVTNQNNQKESVIEKIKSGGKTIVNEKEMSNFCNDYFINIGINMLNTIKDTKEQINIQYNSLSSMYLKPVENDEILEHIHSLKNKCASGYDHISTKTIKHLYRYIVEPLKHIINRTFKTTLVPIQFKTSIVTPIHKAGSRNEISNYRPISVLSNLSKIFEKCLKKRLTDFLNINNIISKNQFGFQNGKSTEDAMYQMVNDITNNLDKSNVCIAAFLDLAKAFDTVSHDILLKILENYGIRGIALKLFQNYLTDRPQKTKIGKTLSDPNIIKIGVPQGSVLGPILFNIYMNSIFNIQVPGKIIAYADDTIVIFAAKTWEDVKQKLILGLNKIKLFFDSHKLSLNIKKSNYMAFSISEAKRPNFNSILIDDHKIPLKEVDNIKYLGIMIDKHLKWDKHVSYLCNKTRYLIHNFFILRQILNTKLLKLIYKALFEQIIRYGIIIWGGLYNRHLQCLNVIQNSILKIIFKKPRLYETKLLYDEEIFNIRTLYILTSCIFLKKNENYHLVSNNYNTRSQTNCLIDVPFSNKNFNQKFINYLAPKFFNKLPENIKKLINKYDFKKKCRRYIYENIDTFLMLIK